LILADGAAQLIADLNGLSVRLEEFSARQLEAIEKETAYLEKTKTGWTTKPAPIRGSPSAPER
jgi:hypothetical protein